MDKRRIMTVAMAAVIAVCCFFGGCAQSDNEHSSSAADESSQMTSELSAQDSRSDGSSASSAPEYSQESSGNTESKASSDSDGTITPRIYEITDDEGHKLYTMGAIHIADASILNMPEYFNTAFAESDAVAVECDPSDDEPGDSSITKLTYPDGTKITDHVSAEDYQKVVNIVSASPHYSDEFIYVMPMKWLALGEEVVAKSIGMDVSYGVDSILIEKAKKDGKEILEVEGDQFQTDLMVNMPEKIQNYLFHHMAETDKYVEITGKAYMESYESWKKGELATGNQEGNDTLSESEKELLYEYYRIMRMDRNLGMAEKAEEYLASGKTVFMAVVSAHFYGKGGIYDLMEQKGYNVRQIY